MDTSFEVQKDIVISLIAKMQQSYDLEDFVYNTEVAKKEYKELARIAKENNNPKEILTFNAIKSEFILQHDLKSKAFKEQKEKNKAIQQDYKADASNLDKVITDAFSGVIHAKPVSKKKQYSLDEIEKQITDSFNSPLLVNTNGSLNVMTKKLLLSRLSEIAIDSNETRRRVKSLLFRLNEKVVISSKPTMEQENSVTDAVEHKPIYSTYNGKEINIAPLFEPQQTK